MDPISAPLARAGDVNLISERLATRDTALSDTNGTVIPSCLVHKHAMVMESTGIVKVVGCMDDKGVVHADGDRRRATNSRKNGEEARERKREKTDGQVPLTPMARLGTPKPSGLTS